MTFDPSLNAARLAAMVARSDYATFEIIEDDTTIIVTTGHPFQGMFTPPFVAAISLRWQASYRNIRYGYEACPPNGNPLNADPRLVVSAQQRLLGLAALLTAAENFFDELDRMAARDGANPNPYSPLYIGKSPIE